MENMVTLEEAKERWRSHTSKVVTRPFGRAKWGVEGDGTPFVTGDYHTLWFLKRERGHIYATTVDPLKWATKEVG